MSLIESARLPPQTAGYPATPAAARTDATAGDDGWDGRVNVQTVLDMVPVAAAVVSPVRDGRG